MHIHTGPADLTHRLGWVLPTAPAPGRFTAWPVCLTPTLSRDGRDSPLYLEVVPLGAEYLYPYPQRIQMLAGVGVGTISREKLG